MDLDRKEYEEEMRKHDLAEIAQYKKAMKRVKKRVSASWYESVLDFVMDGECNHSFSIVDKPVGERQTESGTRFGFIYVYQTSGGCPDGDDYYGEISIPIRGGLYLHYHFSS